jgi:hypothetical protein
MGSTFRHFRVEGEPDPVQNWCKLVLRTKIKILKKKLFQNLQKISFGEGQVLGIPVLSELGSKNLAVILRDT